MEAKTRASSHPIFGNPSYETKDDQKESNRNRRSDGNSRSNFDIDNQDESSSYVPTKSSPKCPECDNNHWLSQCQQFRKMTLIERFKLVRRKGLCDNCLTRGHLARNCPKESFCKVQDCKEKHSTCISP